jgi:hypothetical protein
MRCPGIGAAVKIPNLGTNNVNCHSKLINGRKLYIVRVDGQWEIGRFVKEWHGWLFEGNNQLDDPDLQIIYEFNP